MAKRLDPLGITSAETILSSAVTMQGDISSEGDILIDGKLKGSIKTASNINLGVNAHIVGGLEGRNITVAGRVEGNINATDQLHISETGELKGDFTCQIISIAPGGLFIGKSHMPTRTATGNATEVEEDKS